MKEVVRNQKEIKERYGKVSKYDLIVDENLDIKYAKSSKCLNSKPARPAHLSIFYLQHNVTRRTDLFKE